MFDASETISLEIAQSFVRVNQWMIIVPSASIATLMLCFTFLGDGLRDALDPRTRR